MKTRFSKSLGFLLACSAALCAVPQSTFADEARFFRVVGPTPTTITAFTPDGYITWTNAQIGTNYTVQTARSLGAATNWVDYIQVPVSNSVITLRLYDPHPPSGMALIPAGSFTMGDTLGDGLAEGYTDEVPTQTVYVSAFYMDTNLVSYTFWQQVYQWAKTNGYSFDNAGAGKAASHPVQTVNWYDVVKWCNARSEMAGLTPCYYTNSSLSQMAIYRSGTFDLATNWVNWVANGYRLPTEAEWEKAARGGASGQRFPWGNTISWSQANYSSYWTLSGSGPIYPYDVNPISGLDPTFNDGVYPYTSPVGYFPANGYGLHDMAGNVWQRCWDWYGSYSSGSQTDPRGPASGSYRVDRGGSWDGSASDCRTAYRGDEYPTGSGNYGGFRSVLPPGQP
jgi:formylglycine-generating enzyme required for sulfatase activity